MLGSGVDTSACVSFAACNRPKVDDMACLLLLKICEAHGEWNIESNEKSVTFDEQLGHRDETKDVGCEHSFDVSLGDVSYMFNSKDITSVID